MIGVLIAVSGVVAGWEAHKWFEHESLNRRYRKSVRIAAAITEPRMFPRPPSTTKTRIKIEVL